MECNGTLFYANTSICASSSARDVNVNTKNVQQAPGSTTQLRSGEATVCCRYHHITEVVDDEGTFFRCHLRRRTVPLVGDRIVWKQADNERVVSSVLPRRSELSVTTGRSVRPLVANLDLLLIVFAPAPTTTTNLIDRLLAVAAIQGIDAQLVLNKTDLSDTPEWRKLDARIAVYRTLGYVIHAVCALKRSTCSALRASLNGRTVALMGQSGVGKSTLTNALFPQAGATIGELSGQSGTHTTTVTRLYPLEESTRLVDMPGTAQFNTSHIPATQLVRGFKEMVHYARLCRFRNCQHDAQDRHCAVMRAVQEGAINAERVAHYKQMMCEAEANKRWL